MGIYRLLTKSIVFSARSRRRFFTFVTVFCALSCGTIILLFNFDNFSREGLLKHRGVAIKINTLGNVNYETAQTDIDSNIPGAEAVIYYRFVDFGDNLRVCSINTNYKWAFSEIKPNDLITGSFPSNDKEALVSDKLKLQLFDNEPGAGRDVNIYTEPVIGTKFILGAGPDSLFELKVSGIFDKPEAPSNIGTDTREWIFVSEEAFDELTLSSEHLDYDESQISVHSISIITSGDLFKIFGGETYTNVDKIAASLDNLSSEYGTPEFTSKVDKDENRNLSFMALIIGTLMTFMVSTLYSYLITRFRRREVAVLKAMGYSKWNVRIVVLCEILVVAITGYLIGIILIQGYLWNPFGRQSAYFYQFVTFSFNPPFINPSLTVVLSFFTVVISCVPGFFLITYKILSVRPIEIFRQK